MPGLEGPALSVQAAMVTPTVFPVALPVSAMWSFSCPGWRALSGRRSP
jgi:hypothetical protein